VNLLVFSISDLSQIKDLVGVKSAKTGKIHILYESGKINLRLSRRDVFNMNGMALASENLRHPIFAERP
jgi:hypothetical protein